MSNSKRRCSVCRDYFPSEEMTVVGGVTALCMEDANPAALRTKVPTVRKKRRRRRAPVKKTGATPELKRLVRRRDAFRCRFCAHPSQRLECHHIKYLSEGGPNHECNLIALCDEHHRLVHSNKRVWQPILLACIWMQYVEGRVYSVPRMERVLKDMDMHPDQELSHAKR